MMYRAPRLWLGCDSALVHCGNAGAIQRCTCRDQGRGHRLAILRSGIDRDAAGIDALLLDQVVLRVDGPLGSDLGAALLGAGRIAYDSKLRIRRPLQIQCNVIQASLAFVVDTCRTPLVTLEV